MGSPGYLVAKVNKATLYNSENEKGFILLFFLESTEKYILSLRPKGEVLEFGKISQSLRSIEMTIRNYLEDSFLLFPDYTFTIIQ
jgi:hypothetical protein